ncbi:MAG: DUF748 domain-containing protein [Candidatus Electrothrix sp. AW5]|nr:DUF748 domain-containing protein [Candidatus Electrothrix gigas]
MTVGFQGKVAPDLSLSGKVALRNLDSSLLQSYVGMKNQGVQNIGFSGEQAALEGLIHTVQPAGAKKKILIEQAKVVLPHISIQQRGEKGQQRGQPLLTAGLTTAEGCVLNLTSSVKGSPSPSLSCTDLTLQQADFSAAAPSFFLAPEKTDVLPGLSFDTLKITDSKARLPLQSSEGSSDDLTVPITDLNLEINSLQAQLQQKQQNNLRLEARVGMHGKMSAQGNMYQGKARLELAVDNLNIKLLEKPFAALFQQNLAPTLQHGLLSFQGQLQIPELTFKGKVQLDDFMAQNKQGTLLRWKSGKGSHVLAGMQPFFVHIEELVVQEPKLQLGSPDRKLPGALLTLLRQEENKPVLPPFTIKQCRIQGGSLPSIDTTRNFTAVDGNLTPLAAGTPAIFTFSGKVNNRKFTAQGRLEQNQAEVDNFTVAELPLENIAQQFIEQLALQKQGKVSWIPSDEQGNKKDKQGVIHCTDFLPQQNSEYALLLGILTNKRGEFSLPLSLPATASPAQISKAALKKIHRLHLQGIVSPQALLEKELPDLTLPDRVNCIVGDSLPDFLEDLENFVELLSQRPHLCLELRGCYDDVADREYLLGLLQEEKDYQTNLENIRRQEEMARLLAEEELRQVQLLNKDLPIDQDLTPVIEAREDLQPLPYQPVILSKKILPELARQRARVVQAYLIDTLKLPAEKITIDEISPGGPWVDLLIKPYWPQPAQTTQVSETKKKE